MYRYHLLEEVEDLIVGVSSRISGQIDMDLDLQNKSYKD